MNYNYNWYVFDDMKKYGPMSRHIRRLIFRMIRPLEFASLLDCSCGQGELLSELSSSYPSVELFGTELAESGLAIARERLPDVQFAKLDITSCSLERQFDLVICSDVLEHILEDRKAIANLRKMAGRYLLVTTVQGPFYEYEREAVGHVRSYTRAGLEQKLHEAGFRIMNVYEWGWPFYSPLYRGLLAMTKAQGTGGPYGTFRKLIAQTLFYLFMLNSYKCGDALVILAEVA